MTVYRFLILLAAAIGLALACPSWRPRTLQVVWPVAICLTGTLLEVPVVGILGVTIAAVILTWPVRRAWA